jgi:hypothetical protein
MGMVNVPAGCAGCHKLGIGFSSCTGCRLHFCPGCTARFGGTCPNCGSRLV